MGPSERPTANLSAWLTLGDLRRGDGCSFLLGIGIWREGMEEIREESPAGGETNHSATDVQCPRESVAASIPAEFDLFDCCICLDLIYKPVVLACGHTACFWCVHYAMDGRFESQCPISKCPICRKHYKYFPAICQLLHNLLRKLKPADYKQREEEVRDMERNMNCFSLQFVEDDTCDAPSLEHGTSIAGRKEKLAGESKTPQRISQQVSISDLLCAGCSQLLFRPAVLNCGHVYCELCMVSLRKENLRCRVCGTSHPGHPPRVCFSLNAFLENQFPMQFAARTALFQSSILSAAVAEVEQDVEPPGAAGSTIMVIHYTVGCDYCGMYPIIGLRYRCMDCKEKMGFDLCEACFEARSNLPARFNQRHTPDHSFERDDSKARRIEMAYPAPAETRRLPS